MLTNTSITHPALEVYDLVKNLGIGKNTINEPTGDFFYDPWVTKNEYVGTSIDKLLKKLPDAGEARINVLAPGESYMAHADIDDRYHLNLAGDYSYLIDLKNNRMYPLEVDNKIYLMDTGRIHTASNYGYKNRYQVVIRKLLKNSTLKNPVHVKLQALEDKYNLRYLFDNSFSTTLNMLNKNGCLRRFNKISEIAIEFEIESDMLTEIEACRSNCGFKTSLTFY